MTARYLVIGRNREEFSPETKYFLLVTVRQRSANFGPWLQRPTLQSGQHRAPPHAFRLDG
jgi:hypothetical protein